MRPIHRACELEACIAYARASREPLATLGACATGGRLHTGSALAACPRYARATRPDATWQYFGERHVPMYLPYSTFPRSSQNRCVARCRRRGSSHSVGAPGLLSSRLAASLPYNIRNSGSIVTLAGVFSRARFIPGCLLGAWPGGMPRDAARIAATGAEPSA